MERIRAFIAIELPPPLKQLLTTIQNELKRGQYPSVRWVDPAGIHLTLKFLGNVDAELLPQVTEVMAEAARESRPLRLEIGGLGAFPNLRSPRVVWLGMGGELNILSSLQAHLEQALVPLGFPAEERKFSPHLTLGRVREGAAPEERRRLAEALTGAHVDKIAPLTIDSLSLMRSTLTPAGAIYSRLARAPLGGVEVSGA